MGLPAALSAALLLLCASTEAAAVDQGTHSLYCNIIGAPTPGLAPLLLPEPCRLQQQPPPAQAAAGAEARRCRRAFLPLPQAHAAPAPTRSSSTSTASRPASRSSCR
jgi:hypothetical protein